VGMGIAHELTAPRAGRDRQDKPGGTARRLDGTSVGNRSESATHRAPFWAALRSLFPSGRLRRASAIHPGGSIVRHARRLRRASAAALTIAIALLLPHRAA